MTVNDQTVKMHIILITAVLALVGFVLEMGPVGGAFDLVIVGASLLLPTLGFLPYLALAASALVGVHPGEDEPTPKEPPKEGEDKSPTKSDMTGTSGERVRARVRPELHQMRMFFTALAGFTLFKSLNMALMWPLAQQRDLGMAVLQRGFLFGFIYVALGWFLLWQFLRWFAQRKRWLRLQDELVGGDVARFIAVAFLVPPLIFIINPPTLPTSFLVIDILMQLTLVAGAFILWTARPLSLRRTIISLLALGGVIIVLTIARTLAELTLIA